MDNNFLRNSAPRDATVGSIEVQLLGRFDARSSGQPLKDLHSGKAQELFSYLILHRDRPHLRESLAGILWEDDTSASPRKTLRQTLWQLQSALSSAAPHLERLVEQQGPDWIGLSPQVEMHVDVEALESAFRRVEKVPGHRMPMKEARAAKEALELYRGDLLEGVRHPWCRLERQRFRELYFRLLEKMMNHSLATGDYDAGIEFGVRVLRGDPARERTHRRLMRIYYLQGNRTLALRQYQQCLESLRNELDVKPSRATQRLYEHIREDRSPLGSTEAGRVLADQDGEVLDLLVALRGLLSEARSQVHTEILSLRSEPTLSPQGETETRD